MNELETRAGRSVARLVTVWSDDNETQRFNLTGASVEFEVCDSPGGSLVWAGNAQITDVEAGEVTLVLLGSQTSNKPDSVLYWRARATLPNGHIVDIDEGKLIVRA